MPEEQLEIERKFDVPSGFVLPDLREVPGVATVEGPEERSLEAAYYDTADLRLLRHPVTLRRRTGGPDAGWHVKLPVGDGTRRELRFPLGRASRRPPREVLGPVRGIVRSAPVGPVATLRTHRAVTVLRDEAGTALAEIADDTVTASALGPDEGEAATVTSWRELEVELVDGDESLLKAVAERLDAAGARPAAHASKLGRALAGRLPETTCGGPVAGEDRKGRKRGKKARATAAPSAGEVVLDAVAVQVRAMQEADVGVRTGDPEGVHDLRVACRRLRSMFAAFRHVLRRETTDRLREELQWLGGQLSGARDGQVALAQLRRLIAEQPPELVIGPVSARLQQAEGADAEAGRHSAERALDADRYLRLLDDLHALLEDPPLATLAAEPARDVLARATRRGDERLRLAIARARADGAGDVLHDVRKAAKRLRYTAEVAAPVLGRDARTLVERMTEVQEILGDRQDTIVSREYCRELGLAAFAAGENAWTYGRLHALEEARGAAAEAAFWELEPRLAKAVRRAATA